MNDVVRNRLLDVNTQQREYMLDITFIEEAACNPLTENLVSEYIKGLCNNQNLIFDKTYHQYYATRILRAKNQTYHPSAN